MKKKAIEKIPYLTLKKTSRKKAVKYIGVTAVKIVGHEKHLFLEVYRNEKTAKAVPVVRIVLTKKDFGTYFPEGKIWSRQKVYGNTYKLIWQSEDDRTDTWDVASKKNILENTGDVFKSLRDLHMEDKKLKAEMDLWTSKAKEKGVELFKCPHCGTYSEIPHTHEIA